MYNSNDIAERIKRTAKDKRITIAELTKHCELGANALGSMREGKMPSVERIAKIADYLEISVDYLLGRTEKKLIDKTMSKEEEILVAAYQAKPEMQSAVRRLLEIPEPIDTKISDNDIASDMVKTVNTLSKSTATKS